MILQLNISNGDIKDSVYRKVLVDDQMTFEDLNELIQLIFQTPHFYPYLFTIYSSQENEQPTFIGYNYNKYFQIPDDILHKDYDELLRRWLVKENNVAYYQIGIDDEDEPITYTIALEKILAPSQELQYPLCIGAQGFHSQQIAFMKQDPPSEEMIVKLCNEIIEQVPNLFGDDRFDWKRSFETATRLNELKPWEYLSEQQLFVIEEPLSKDLLFCSITGAASEAFGLVVYPGYNGRMSLEMLQQQNFSTPEYLLTITRLIVNFCKKNELNATDYELIKDHHVASNEKNNWVQFRSYEPGYFPWIPDSLDMMILQIAMEQTIEIIQKIQRGWLLPTFNKPHLYFGRKIEFNGAIPQWVDTIFDTGEFTQQAVQMELSLSEFELAKLKRYPNSTVELEFDVFYLPEAIQDTSWDRPFFPSLAIAVDKNTGMTVYEERINKEKDNLMAQTALHALLLKNQAKPEILHITKEMEPYLKPFTDAIKVSLVVHETLDKINPIKAHLYDIPIF